MNEYDERQQNHLPPLLSNFLGCQWAYLAHTHFVLWMEENSAESPVMNKILFKNFGSYLHCIALITFDLQNASNEFLGYHINTILDKIVNYIFSLLHKFAIILVYFIIASILSGVPSSTNVNSFSSKPRIKRQSTFIPIPVAWDW